MQQLGINTQLFTAIKIGGSIITNRKQYRTLNWEEIDIYGDFISKNRSAFDNCFLILGGGSFGNIIPFKYNLNGGIDQELGTLLDTHQMTKGMTELSASVCDRWSEYKISCYPLPVSSFLYRDELGALQLLNASILKLLLKRKIIPLLTADLIFREHDNDKKYEVFSSDHMATMLSDHFNLEKTIIFTDVDGVLDPKTQIPFSEVNQDNVENILTCATGSSVQDYSGGMKTKLSALLDLSAKGVTSYICNGKKMNIVEEAILNNNFLGTKINKNITVA